ncbi:MAG TPA: F0F1 ATP synthase subunit A [Candidatus Kapabacteria bacterium]|nr:F0F1 ATP synthase subunit A [Candidatus Kapabacteria bacterium]
MYDPDILPLLAQNEPGTTTAPGTPNQGGQEGTTKAPEHREVDASKSDNPFIRLFSDMGDHREIKFGNTTVVKLPVILIDHGLHIYPDIEKMEEEGTYQFTHHHIVRKGTEQTPSLDLSITSMVAFQWLAMVVLLGLLIPMARKYRKNGVRPMRGIFNALEALVVYVRDEIVVPNAGESGMALLPVFLTFFFFILTANLIGALPGGHAATSSINVTAGLAAIAFVVIQGAAIRKHGLVNWLKHLTGGVHWSMWPIMIPVEIMGLFTKPFALCVRLFANMTAGHVMLLSLIGLVFVTAGFIPVTIAFSLFVNCLELLVIFLQAYIFTMLTAVFTGMGTAGGHDDHGHAPATAH